MQEEIGGKLYGACCYLSGAIESASDDGVGWRRRFIDLSKEANLHIDFIDPTNKPGGIDVKIKEDKNYQIDLQNNGEFLKLKEYVSEYRRYDLRFVDLSDFLVVAINPKIHICGTYDEVFTAERQHKPIFFICEGGLKKLPRWLFGVVDVEDKDNGIRGNVFETIEQVIDELVQFDTGKIHMNDEWVLIRKHLEKVRSK